jgi:AcrR family transcriptional regulator
MVQNIKRARGRPRCFDTDDVLDKATRVFWKKGYDATTIDDLVEAMGIGRPSLYAIFGDKEAVFKQCLSRYATAIGDRLRDTLNVHADVREAIRAFLIESIQNVTRDETTLGCLSGSVAAVVDNPAIRQSVADSVRIATGHVAARLAAAVAEGQLPGDFPVEQKAKQVVDMSLAFGLRARIGIARTELLADAAHAIDVFFGVS